MLSGRTYDEVCRNFKWEIPEYYNIGVDVCDKWAGDKHRLALIYLDPQGRKQKYTFRELRNISNQAILLFARTNLMKNILRIFGWLYVELTTMT